MPKFIFVDDPDFQGPPPRPQTLRTWAMRKLHARGMSIGDVARYYDVHYIVAHKAITSGQKQAAAAVESSIAVPPSIPPAPPSAKSRSATKPAARSAASSAPAPDGSARAKAPAPRGASAPAERPSSAPAQTSVTEKPARDAETLRQLSKAQLLSIVATPHRQLTPQRKAEVEIASGILDELYPGWFERWTEPRSR